MRSKSLVFLLLFGSACIAQAPGSLSVKHVYTGADGLTHFDTVSMPMKAGSGPLALAETAGPEKASTAFITRLAPGYVQDWTRAPAKRWVTVVSGRAEIGGSNGEGGGETVMAGAGDVLLVEDTTGKGHTFRVVGAEPWVAVVVNLQP